MKNHPIAIFDIDGVLANGAHRKYILTPLSFGKIQRGSIENISLFNAYVLAAEKDSIFEDEADLLRMTHNQGLDIILITARPEWSRLMTTHWLARHWVPYTEMYMRESECQWSDVDVKIDIYNKHLRGNGRRIMFAVEDRIQCVKMWRKLGITCLQPRDGDY